MDLAELLTSGSEHRTGLLDSVRASWPLNQKAAGLEKPSDSSDRVRLRRTLDTLQGWGITASGIEPSHLLSGAQVVFRGSFSTQGSLKEKTLGVEVDETDLVEQVQMALHSAGWPAVVSRNNALMVSREPVSDEDVLWMELGFFYPIPSLTPERASEWIEHCPSLSSGHSLQSAELSGISPQAMQPWTDLEDEQGDCYIARHPELVAEWIAAGKTPKQAESWFAADYRLMDYDLVDRWIAAGCSPAEASAWINLIAWGADPDKISEWTDKGLTTKHAMRIMHAEGSSWSLRSLMEQGNATPAEAVAWLESGVINYSTMQLWLDLGVGGHELRRWNRAAHKGGLSGNLSLDQISLWLDQGRTLAQAEPWLELNAEFINVKLVLEWEAEGLSPEDAADWARSGVPQLAEVRAWQATHPACSDPSLVGELVESGLRPDQASLVLDKLQGP